MWAPKNTHHAPQKVTPYIPKNTHFTTFTSPRALTSAPKNTHHIDRKPAPMLALREFKVSSVYFFNKTLKTIWVTYKFELQNNAAEQFSKKTGSKYLWCVFLGVMQHFYYRCR